MYSELYLTDSSYNFNTYW